MKKNMGLRLLKKLMFFIFLPLFISLSYGQQGFTQADRELLIEMRTRLTEVDKRFDQADIRISELRSDMNKRFDQMMGFIEILAAIFTAMTLLVISFAFWDRKTMLRPLEAKIAELNDKTTTNCNLLKRILTFLKEYSLKNKTFAETGRRLNLF